MSLDTLRGQGASNKFFYYTSSGEYTTFNMREQVVLDREITAEQLGEAAYSALAGFPELRVRPVVHDNRVFYEPVDVPVIVVNEEKDPAPKHFGTADTNGYLFYFILQERGFELSFFHGLADGVGMEAYIDCLLYLLGQRTGVAEELNEMPPAYTKRFGDERKELSVLDEEEIDPYGYFTEKLSLSADAAEPPAGAFFIPRDEDLMLSSRMQGYTIRLPFDAYRKYAKEQGASFTSMLAPLLTRAVADAFDTGEEPVAAMLPANLRQLYGDRTYVNFSDGMFLPFTAADRGLSLAEQAQRIGGMIKQGLSRTYFDAVVAGKVAAVRGFEGREGTIAELSPKPVVSLPEGEREPMTYALTTPRREKTPGFVKAIHYALSASASIGVIIYTFGNDMFLRFSQKFASDRIAAAALELFGKEGLAASLDKEPLLTGDCLKLSELETR